MSDIDRILKDERIYGYIQCIEAIESISSELNLPLRKKFKDEPCLVIKKTDWENLKGGKTNGTIKEEERRNKKS